MVKKFLFFSAIYIALFLFGEISVCQTDTLKNPQWDEIHIRVPSYVDLTRYTFAIFKNSFKETLFVYGDSSLILSIKSKEIGKFFVGGYNNIIFKFGIYEFPAVIKPKEAPKIQIDSLQKTGPESSLKRIQEEPGFRVTIISKNFGDLNVKVRGPVNTKQISAIIFEVKLHLLDSEESFIKWIKGRESPYKAIFTVTVEDKYVPEFKIEEKREFIFGKW